MNRARSTLLAVAMAAGMACAAPAPISPDSPVGRARLLLDAQRYAEARDAFVAALETAPDDPRALLGLGAAFEGLGALDSARAVYEALAERPISSAVRRRLNGRMRVLDREVRRREARRLAAAEATLSAQAPAPRTIAVLPFTYSGPDSSLRPLERALAQFVVTDLSQVGGVRLLERQAVQFLLEELALAAGDRVDPTTAARPGRLLRAEHVVTGGLTGSEAAGVRLDGTAVRTATANIAAAAGYDDRLAALFDLEKQVVLDLLDGMNIQVTPLERERILERPTASFIAFLRFGEGLLLEDAGRFRAAQEAYRAAATADPGFAAARAAAANAEDMASAETLTLDRVAGLLDAVGAPLGFLADNLNDVMGSAMQTGDRVQNPRGAPPPGGRDGVGDLGGQDRLGGLAEIFIRIRRP